VLIFEHTQTANGLESQVAAIVQSQLMEMTNRYSALESKLIKVIENRASGLTDTYSDSVRVYDFRASFWFAKPACDWCVIVAASTQEKRTRHLLDQQTEQMEARIKSVERRIAEMLEEHHREVTSRQSSFRSDLLKDVQLQVRQTTKSDDSSSSSRQHLETKLTALVHASLQRYDADTQTSLGALRDDLSRQVQHQLKTAEASQTAVVKALVDTSNTRASADQAAFKEVRQRAWTAEQTCSRLAEDIMRRLESHQSCQF
jgi:hypothetical protein